MWEITPARVGRHPVTARHGHLDVKRMYRRCSGSHHPEAVMIEAIVPIKAD
jgi:hypothetical protein